MKFTGDNTDSPMLTVPGETNTVLPINSHLIRASELTAQYLESPTRGIIRAVL